MTNTKHSERGSQQFWEEMDKEYEIFKEDLWRLWRNMMELTDNMKYELIVNDIDKERDET